MRAPDPRVVLGLPWDATLEDAHRAFRRLAKRAHPDAGGEVQGFLQVRAAYDELRRTLGQASTVAIAGRSPYDRLIRPPAAGRSWVDSERRVPPVRSLTFHEVLCAERGRLARQAA